MKLLPQKTAREVRGHDLVTVLMFAQARAYRLPCAQDALGKALVGWQRWRRPRFEETRNQVMVLAQGC